MTYLNCENCGWKQDHFWKENFYNPIKDIYANWEDSLFPPIDLDQKFEHSNVTYRELIVYELEKAIHKIKNMKYRTKPELYKNNPEMICPNCEQHTLEEKWK